MKESQDEFLKRIVAEGEMNLKIHDAQRAFKQKRAIRFAIFIFVLTIIGAIVSVIIS